jgi:hypothetical protein
MDTVRTKNQSRTSKAVQGDKHYRPRFGHFIKRKRVRSAAGHQSVRKSPSTQTMPSLNERTKQITKESVQWKYDACYSCTHQIEEQQKSRKTSSMVFIVYLEHFCDS